MARKTLLETILCSQNKLSGLYQVLKHQTSWKKLCLPGNDSEAPCCMASRMEWHWSEQEEADRPRLLLFENTLSKKCSNIY